MLLNTTNNTYAHQARNKHIHHSGATPWTTTFCASSATHGGSKLSHSNLPQTDGDSLLDFTWVKSVQDAAQQPSKSQIGLCEKGFQTPHDEGQILWTEGDMELWLKLY